MKVIAARLRYLYTTSIPTDPKLQAKKGIMSSAVRFVTCRTWNHDVGWTGCSSVESQAVILRRASYPSVQNREGHVAVRRKRCAGRLVDANNANGGFWSVRAQARVLKFITCSLCSAKPSALRGTGNWSAARRHLLLPTTTESEAVIMPRGERRHSKASDGGSSMDTSFTTVGGHPYYQYHGGGGGGSGQQQHPPPHQMSHHRGRQHPQRAPSPMMVSSPTPPYLPPHYGDPNLPPYYPIQQTPGASSSGHHQHQHHIPMHSAQPPQPLISGSAYQQPPPYYPVQQSYPLPPPPPTANTTPTNAMPPIGGTSGGTGDSIMGGAVAGSAGNSDPLVQQDIERGLRIDFYSETDAMLLASWASFFRDQFVEARQELAKASFDRNAETYRRATHFVERVETKILKTNAMKQLFRRHPLTNINDPVSVSFLPTVTVFFHVPFYAHSSLFFLSFVLSDICRCLLSSDY